VDDTRQSLPPDDEDDWIVQRGLEAWVVDPIQHSGRRRRGKHYPEHECFMCATTRAAMDYPPILPSLGRIVLDPLKATPYRPYPDRRYG
jgi:hypothetical protein